MKNINIKIEFGRENMASLEEKMDLLWKKSLEEVAIAQEEKWIKPPSQTNAVGLSKWLSSQIKEITEKMDEVEALTGVKCVCDKGCDACCKQAIQVLPTEAKAIAAYIGKFSTEEKQKLQRKIDEWKKQIEESGLDTDQNKYYQSRNVEQEIYTFMDQYFKLGIPCPMLSEKGACTIYPVRPGGCWSYRVYSNREDCKQYFEVAGSIKHDEWERYLLDVLFSKIKGDKGMKLLPYYIDDILKHRL